MSSFVHLLDQRRLIGPGGSTVSGTLAFYYTGTSVLAPVYQDAALTVPSPNPVEVGAGEVIPPLFLDTEVVYRRVITYSDGTYDEQDPLGALFSEGELGLPVGSVIDFSGTVAPEGFILCYGQEVGRSVYPDLFSAIGTTYGAGNGTTTFNLPDGRGRVVAGKDNMGGVAAGRLTSPVAGSTLGATGGSQSHTLTDDELPSHTHTGTTGDQSVEGSILKFWDGLPHTGINGVEEGQGGSDREVQSYNHTHSFTTDATGSDDPHNNTQPTLILNKIIKAKETTFISLIDIAFPTITDKANASAIGIDPTALDMGIFLGNILLDGSTTKEALQTLSDYSETSLKVFETLTDLKASTEIFLGQFVKTLGYYASQDGGGNTYEIVNAGSGSDDGGSYINLSGSGLQAKGVFEGHVVQAEKFGCVNGVEASAQLTAASVFAATVLRPNAAHRQAKLVMASNINAKDSITIGVSGRQLDVDLQGSTINCVTGGNLSATEPAVTLYGYDSKRFVCTIICNKLCSGWFISGSGSWTERANARRFASHADAYGIWNDVGNITDPSCTEWEPSDVEFDTQANFLGRGLVVNAKDNYVVNARPAWSNIVIHLTSNSGGNTLIGCHPYHGNPNSGSGGSEFPALRFDNPIILKSEASYVVRLIGCYLDNGIVHDLTSHIRMTGGDIFTNGESILTAPRFRIKEQVSGNYDTILDDVVTSVGVMQSDMITASTDYAQWGSIPALQGGAAVKVRQRETNFFTYPSSGSNPLVTDVIGNRTGGYHRRIVFNNGVEIDEVVRSTSWEIRAPFRTYNPSDDSGTLYIGNKGSNITTGGIAGDYVFYRGANPVWEINSSLGNLRPSLDNSASLGAGSRRLADIYTVKATFSPGIGTTLTPPSNGDLMIETTSNTSVKIKLKGSDGVVRSATLTLS